ncbi:MAG: LysM peptidoglycan-binding domain-containing protein [Flavobacteriia bacterium]
MRIILSVSLIICFLTGVYSQKAAHLVKPGDTLNKDPFINTVEQSLRLFLTDYVNKNEYDSIIKALNYEPDHIPQFTDEQYCEHIKKLNETTPFKFECNQATLSTIKFFVKSRRSFARIILGRSNLYFDMFEEKLSEYGLPLELKFLPVIESGLRPQVKSHAGALGLWQFMYRTGLYFGLKENSYLDERMDPVLATDAACRYLKQLYGIYGEWNLALAAYNAGPGNVNHAIRRSGNKTTYWEVRPYLPSETQAYVPNFLAAAYLLTFHAEHNILPIEPKVHYAQLDTMCLSSGMHMATISKLVNWPVDDIKSLNPVYKSTYIPKTNPGQCISGPLEKIGLLVSLEDSLYAMEKRGYSGQGYVAPKPVVETPVIIDTVQITDSLGVSKGEAVETYIYHKVKSGETMASIATKYKVTIQQLMEWNALRTSNIYVGQRLKLKTGEAKPVVKEVPKETPAPEPPVVKKYYAVRAGDTFSKIADRNGLTQTQLSRLNPGVNVNRLNVGQQIRIK